MLSRPAVSRSLALVSGILRRAIATSFVLLLGMSSVAQQTQAQQPTPQQQTPPAQDSNRPPDAYDQSTQEAQAPGTQYPTVPNSLTIPAGTVLLVRTNDFLSSDQNRIGDQFTGTLEQPIVVNGWVVARRGQAQTGRVSTVKKGRAGGSSELGVEIPELTLVDGPQLQVDTALVFPGAHRDHRGLRGTQGGGKVLGEIGEDPSVRA